MHHHELEGIQNATAKLSDDDDDNESSGFSSPVQCGGVFGEKIIKQKQK